MESNKTALSWWRDLTPSQKYEIKIKHDGIVSVSEEQEITEIYRKEHRIVQPTDLD